MRRRRFIFASVAAGVTATAGCAELLGVGDDEPTPSPNGQADSGPTEELDALLEPGRTVEFTNIPLAASVPDGSFKTDDGIVMAVDIIEPATEIGPAILRMGLQNTRSFGQPFELGRTGILDHPPWTEANGTNLLVLPADSRPIGERATLPVTDTMYRWRPDSLMGPFYPEYLHLEAEETLIADFYLLSEATPTSAPFGPGRYTFEGDEPITISIWDHEAPGPSGQSRFDDTTVPSPQKDMAISWYHEATDQTEVYLQPATEFSELPTALGFEVVNYSSEPVDGRLGNMNLYKFDGSEWFDLTPNFELPYHGQIVIPELPTLDHHEPALPIDVGERTTVYPGDTATAPVMFNQQEGIEHENMLVAHFLGNGRYAIESEYQYDGAHLATMFELDGPALEVEPEADATLDVDIDAVTVELPTGPWAIEPVEVVVEQSISEGFDFRVISEQLYQTRFRSLRNSIPLFDIESVETVRVIGPHQLVEPFQEADTESLKVEFEGGFYQMTAAVRDQTD